MTIPPPLPATAITSILLADGVWHPVTSGTLVGYYNPAFTSLVAGQDTVSVGGMWCQFKDSSNSLIYGAPVSEIKAVEFTPQQGQ